MSFTGSYRVLHWRNIYIAFFSHYYCGKAYYGVAGRAWSAWCGLGVVWACCDVGVCWAGLYELEHLACNGKRGVHGGDVRLQVTGRRVDVSDAGAVCREDRCALRVLPGLDGRADPSVHEQDSVDVVERHDLWAGARTGWRAVRASWELVMRLRCNGPGAAATGARLRCRIRGSWQ